MTHLLLLDRDGTITQNRNNPGGFITGPDDIELIPGVLDRLREYHASGWAMAIVSNQGGIGAGFTTEEIVVAGMQRTMELLEGMARFCIFCPAFPPQQDNQAFRVYPDGSVVEMTHLWGLDVAGKGFRKPNPRMLLESALLLEAPLINCLMIGDRSEDEGAAQAAGIPFQWAKDFFK